MPSVSLTLISSKPSRSSNLDRRAMDWHDLESLKDYCLLIAFSPFWLRCKGNIRQRIVSVCMGSLYTGDKEIPLKSKMSTFATERFLLKPRSYINSNQRFNPISCTMITTKPSHEKKLIKLEPFVLMHEKTKLWADSIVEKIGLILFKLPGLHRVSMVLKSMHKHAPTNTPAAIHIDCSRHPWSKKLQLHLVFPSATIHCLNTLRHTDRWQIKGSLQDYAKQSEGSPSSDDNASIHQAQGFTDWFIKNENDVCW